jgi:hypothetical protein
MGTNWTKKSSTYTGGLRSTNGIEGKNENILIKMFTSSTDINPNMPYHPKKHFLGNGNIMIFLLS